MNTLENVAIYRLKSKEWTEELPPLPLSGVLDPLLIDPLGRTRLKKLKTIPWTPGENKTQVGRIKANVFYRPSCPFAFLFVVIYTWGTPYNGLYMYGEVPPKRGIFFRLQVYKRVGKSVISVCKKAQKG